MLFCLQSLLGEFNKEQEAFIKEKQGKVSDAAVPPWVGCPNEESLKEEFLTLSTVSAIQFVHTFCLMTAAFLITHQSTLTLLKIVYSACFSSIMTLLCMPLHQFTLTTWLVMHDCTSGYTTTLLVLPATVSGYTHITFPSSKIGLINMCDLFICCRTGETLFEAPRLVLISSLIMKYLILLPWPH